MQAGGELQRQNEAHRARLARMGSAPKIVPVYRQREYVNIEAVPFDPEPIEVYWQSMWMWDLVDPRERRASPPAIAEIIKETAAYYKLPVTELLAHRRNHRVVLPRQVGMYMAKILTQHSLPEIGRRFAGRDHTTVLHAVRKIESQVRTHAHITTAVSYLNRRLGFYG